MSEMAGIKAELTQNLKHLHLPTIRECYEDVARQAERETLSYERYLHEVVQRECDERLENRTAKMLRESQLPLEKSLEMFDVRRLPPKAARQMRTLLRRRFSGSHRERSSVRESWKRQNESAASGGSGTHPERAADPVYHLRDARAGTADR